MLQNRTNYRLHAKRWFQYRISACLCCYSDLFIVFSSGLASPVAQVVPAIAKSISELVHVSLKLHPLTIKRNYTTWRCFGTRLTFLPQVPPDDLCAALLPSTFDLVLLHDAPLGLPRALWSGRLLQCLTSLLKPAAWLYVQHRGAEDDLVSDGAMRDLGLEARAFPDVPGPECAGREFCGRFYRASARAHDAAAGPAGVGAAAVAPGQSGGAAFVADPTALHTRRSLRPPGALHHQREAARLRCALCTRPLVSAGETRRRALAALERRWDRKQLNTRVLPAVARANLSLVLWVGTQPYTLGYNDLFLFGSDSVLVTDDPVPASALFGAGAHFQALVQDLCAVVANGTFDAVLLHGVFGRGLTQKADQMAFLTCAAALLRPAGVLYLGYNFSPRASRVKAVPVGVAKGYAKDTWSAALGALGFVREAFGEQPGQVCTDGRGGDGYGRGFCMEFWTLRKGE